MSDFTLRSVLPAALLAIMSVFASGTHSDAQTTLNPPPVPEGETVAETTPKPPAADTEVTPPPPPQDDVVVPPPPPPPPPAEKFFVSTDGSTEGPFALSELKARVAAGTFSATTYVWQDGMDGWKRAEEVEVLSEVLKGVTDNPGTTVGDINTFLTGIWEDKNASFVPGLGQVQLDLLIEYYPNGTMDGIGTFTTLNAGNRSVYDVYLEGTWRAQNSTGNMFDLTTNAVVSIGLVESPVYTGSFQIDETVTHERTGPNSFRDVADNLTYTRH